MVGSGSLTGLEEVVVLEVVEVVEVVDVYYPTNHLGTDARPEDDVQKVRVVL